MFDLAIEELKAGQKQSHWMWFVFPQLKGLGRSSTAQLYGISGLDEATGYLEHPVLGPRLEAAVTVVDESPAASLRALFGTPDDLKFHSSMTLFAIVARMVLTKPPYADGLVNQTTSRSTCSAAERGREMFR